MMLYEVYDYPTFYIAFLRVQTILGVPLNCFTLYLIFRKSGKHMREYRYYLAATQSISSLSELLLGCVCVEVLFPALAAIMHGFVGNDYWWSQIIFMSLLCVFGALFISILLCFVYRHQQLLELNSPYKLSNVSIIAISIVYYIVELVPLAVIWFCIVLKKASNEEVEQLAQEFPDMAPMLSSAPTFWTMKNTPTYPIRVLSAPMLLILLLGFYALLHALMGVFLVLNSIQLLTRHNEHLSAKTRQMQRTFLTSLILQTLIPTFWMAFPIVCLFPIVTLGIPIGQGINRVMVCVISCHGTVASLAVLCIYEPYRFYVLKKMLSIVRRFPRFRRFEDRCFPKTGKVSMMVSAKHTNTTVSGILRPEK